MYRRMKICFTTPPRQASAAADDACDIDWPLTLSAITRPYARMMPYLLTSATSEIFYQPSLPRRNNAIIYNAFLHYNVGTAQY